MTCLSTCRSLRPLIISPWCRIPSKHPSQIYCLLLSQSLLRLFLGAGWGWFGFETRSCVAQVNFSFSVLLSLPSQTCTTMQGRALEVQSGSTRRKALASLTVKPSVILSETYPFHIPKVFKHLSGWDVAQTGVKQNTKQTHTLPFHGP